MSLWIDADYDNSLSIKVTIGPKNQVLKHF